ncbi:hypothetical protein GCM10007028_24250 [Algibacter mikhailovii]|uniref:Uncharacterized protein n=1 Tax=Algibacter mikhailovii TaxID=425498 RepID=A0A918R6A5_9FLAO|nr:hypothetical protein GCM10007028_24250 [Algibacter mikhailovii]
MDKDYVMSFSNYRGVPNQYEAKDFFLVHGLLQQIADVLVYINYRLRLLYYFYAINPIIL